MTTSTLQPRRHRIAHQLTGDGRGILAADESIKTMYGFPHAAHQLGVLPGVKVDTGTTPLPGDNGALITEGLDGLGDRLATYAEQGAAFAKWRAVYSMETTTPYAGTVLKPSFVTPGLGASPRTRSGSRGPPWRRCASMSRPTSRASRSSPVGTRRATPAPTSGVCAIGERPWAATFSFGRALVSDALHRWAADTSVIEPAQEVLLASCTEAASASRWQQPEAPSRRS